MWIRITRQSKFSSKGSLISALCYDYCVCKFRSVQGFWVQEYCYLSGLTSTENELEDGVIGNRYSKIFTLI